MPERAPNSSTLWKGLNLPFKPRLNARRPGPVTALDFDEDTLRAAQAVPRGNRTVISRTIGVPLDLADPSASSDPAAVGEAIARALDDAGFKASSVVMGVPRHLVMLRPLSLPAIDDIRELASMVHMQIGKDLPFRQEDAIIDFEVRSASAAPEKTPGQDEASNTAARDQLLVAAVRRETVEFYQKVAAAAKLKLVALGWLSQANARCLQECGQCRSNEGVALVSLRPNEVGIDVVAQGGLLFSRGASIKSSAETSENGGNTDHSTESPTGAPSSPAPTPETYINSVFIEVVRSLHAYGGMEARAPIQTVLVAGATGREDALVKSLQERLSLNCARLDPSRAMDLPKNAEDQAAEALGAIGLGLGVNDPEGLPFDFLHPKRPAVQRNTQRIRRLAMAATVAALFITVLGVRAHLIKKRMKVNAEVKAQLAQAETKLPIYRKMRQQAATLQNWTHDSRNWLEQYAYLSAVLPPCEDLYITSLSVSGQGNIHLAVQARSGEILANLDRQLRAAGYDVKPLAITPGNDKYGYNFRSTVELIIPGKMKIDLAKTQTPPRPADDGSLDPKTRPGRKGGRS